MIRTSEQFWNEFHKKRWDFIGSYDEIKEQESKMLEEWYNEMAVGDHCHICHYSDVSPVTVVKRTAKTITVRYDKAERDPEWKPEWIPGGFSAYCTNNDEQRWIISEDLDGKTDVFRWSKVYNVFRNKHGEKLFPEWRKHYDYNF